MEMKKPLTIEQKANAIKILNKIAKGQKINFAEKNIVRIYNDRLGKIKK